MRPLEFLPPAETLQAEPREIDVRAILIAAAKLFAPVCAVLWLLLAVTP